MYSISDAMRATIDAMVPSRAVGRVTQRREDCFEFYYEAEFEYGWHPRRTVDVSLNPEALRKWMERVFSPYMHHEFEQLIEVERQREAPLLVKITANIYTPFALELLRRPEIRRVPKDW